MKKEVVVTVRRTVGKKGKEGEKERKGTKERERKDEEKKMS